MTNVPQKGWGLMNPYPFTRKQSWPQSCEDPLQLATATRSSWVQGPWHAFLPHISPSDGPYNDPTTLPTSSFSVLRNLGPRYIWSRVLRDKDSVTFFYMWMSSFPSTMFLQCVFLILCKNKQTKSRKPQKTEDVWTYNCFFILFFLSMYLLLCQNHADFMTIAL